jgi:hypothetical protein
MNALNSFRMSPLSLLAVAMLTWPVRAEEMVTIPKSRLQELERKELEWEKLKRDLGKAQAVEKRLTEEQQRLKDETEKLRAARKAAEAAAAAAVKVEAVIQHNTPPISSMPLLQKGEIVDAMDLMNHYRADEPAAERRYGAHPILVQGEVMGFDKPMFVSEYVIYLKTTERNWKVMCRVSPPEKYSATFTVKGGEEIVGVTSAGARTTMAKVGQTVVVGGRCNGLRDQLVKLSGCTLQPRQ